MLKNIFKKINYKLFLCLLLLICGSVFAIKPFFSDGFFPVHDNVQVERVYEMGQALKDGIFPVRWTNDLGYGYGYPIFNFYAPLPYYIAGIFLLFGINALIATKIMFIFGILMSGVFMFFLARNLFGEKEALIVSTFYLYAPYHAVNIYARGDIGEVWSYAFIPLIFYFIYKIYKTKKIFFSALLGLSYAFIILSHNLSAFMVSPFILLLVLYFVYISFKTKKDNGKFLIIGGLVLGLLLSAFYFIPALSEMNYTNVNSIIGGGSDFRNHFVCINQLWESIWGFGGSNPGCMDGISFRLGKVQIILTILSFAVFIFNFKKIKREDKHLYFALAGGLLLSLFLIFSISQTLWEVLIPMKYIQFPWRFIAFVNFFSVLLIGYLFYFIAKSFPKTKIVSLFIAFVLLFGLFLSNAKLFVPQRNIDYPSDYYTNKANINWVASRISDEYMPSNFVKPENPNEVPKRILEEQLEKFVDISNSTSVKEVVAYFPKTKVYVLNIAYFPAWQAYINENKAPIVDVNGKIGVKIEKGYQLIRLQFEHTKVESSANLFSIIGLIATITVIILGVKQKNEKIS